MAWFNNSFGDGFSSIKDQITKITKDVLLEDPLAVTSYEGRIEELQNELKHLRGKVEDAERLEAQFIELSKENKELKKAVEDLDAEHEKAQRIIEERLCNVGIKEGSTTENDWGSGGTDNEELKNEVSTLKQENARLRQHLTSISQELDSNKEILNAFNDRLEESEGIIKELKDEIATKEKENDTLKNKLSRMENIEVKFNEAQLQLEDADSLIRSLMEEADKCKEIEFAFESLNFENSSLKERVLKLESAALSIESKDLEIAQLKENYLKTKEELDLAVQKLTEKEDESREANEKEGKLLLVESKNRLCDLELSLEETKTNYRELELLYNTALSDLDCASKKASELETQLEEKEEAISLLKRSIDELEEIKARSDEELKKIRENNERLVAENEIIRHQENNEETVLKLKTIEEQLSSALQELNLKNQALEEIDNNDEKLKMLENESKEYKAELERVRSEIEEIKLNRQSLQEEKTAALDKIVVLTKEIDSLAKENTELKARVDDLENSKKQLNSLLQENKNLQEKIEKLGGGVLVANLGAQIEKLRVLARRMQPIVSSTQRDEEDDAMHLCQTDDVKRLQQDLTTMASNIQLVEIGVNALESNISQWAAAVASRDQIIQSQQSRLEEVEKAMTLSKNRIDELQSQNDEWEKRLTGLQNLYEKEVSRLENVSNERDDELPSRQEDNSELNDKVVRLLRENSDLKDLVQQLRANALEVNSRASSLRASPTNSPSISPIPDKEVMALKEKEASLKKELERLRAHLVEVEEHYTNEAMSTQAELSDLRNKLATAEEQLRNSNTVYKSANVRATQHVDALNSQIQLITAQRNDLQAKLSEAEDQAQKQAAALTSLQLVLEQFQLDKQREINALEERHENQMKLERRRMAEVQEELITLEKKFTDAQNALKAAHRLGEQLENTKHQLKDSEVELEKVRTQLATARNQVERLQDSTSAKIDKSLVKNLVVGYLGAQGEQKNQALRILTAVLDLSAEERNRAGLRPSEGGWLASILHPNSNNSHQSESLAQAFVRFLESESRPQPQLRLLPNTETQQEKRTPIVLSELVLPSVTPTPVPDSPLSGVFNDS